MRQKIECNGASFMNAHKTKWDPDHWDRVDKKFIPFEYPSSQIRCYHHIKLTNDPLAQQKKTTQLTKMTWNEINWKHTKNYMINMLIPIVV